MMRFHPTFHVFAILSTIIAITAVAALPAAAQDRTYAVEPVAVTGDPAPGTGGLSFEWVAVSDYNLSLSGGLINSYLNDSGVVAFIGSTDPLNPDIREGVWVGTPGNLSLAGRAGDPVPGGTTQIFREFVATQLNEAGGLAVHAYTLDGDLYGSGVWAGPVGSLNLLAMNGDLAPGTAGRTFGSFSIGAFDDLGAVSFYSETFLTYPPDNPFAYETGIWTGTQGLLEPVVMTGDPAPGTGSFAFTGVLGPLSNNADSLTFLGQINDPNLLYPMGLWTAGPAGLSLTALQGNEAPGTGGRTFREFGGPSTEPQIVGEPYTYGIVGPVLTAAGDVAFGAYLENVIDPNIWRGDHGIWVRDAGGLWLKALTGDPAPGTASALFLEFNHINFNAQGLMAFDASLNVADPDRDHGIWLGLPDAPVLVVQEGDPAPGTTGETFGSLIMGPNLNDSGEIVFSARLRESSTDGAWAGTPGNLALILREGEAVEVKPGDYRTIELVAFFEGGLTVYAQGRNFNNAGQLVFFVTFTDGSKGLLLASPVTGTTNLPPVASAGPDLTAKEGQTITLDGTGSTDPEKTVMSFVWSVGGVEIATGPRASVSLFGAGAQTVTLTVTDRGGASVSDDMILTLEANLRPVADAGPDQTVDSGQTVTFDGSGSSDPEGSALTYVWSVGGVQIATGINPAVEPFAVGTFTVTLTATDIHGASASDELVLTVLNGPPVANAGPDQTANYIQTVTLDGTGSSDPDGSVLTYVWSVDGTQIATGANATIGPFAIGTYTITLTVTDDKGASGSDTMILTVKNDPPIARAWVPGAILSLDTAQLDGRGSSDPEGGPLDYVWTIDGVQIGVGPRPVVGPFPVGSHLVTLTVTDVHGLSGSITREMTVINRAPVADSGPDQTVNYAQIVVLDGTASYDPEGGPLSYSWLLTWRDQQIATGPKPTVGPFPIGGYRIWVTVTDEHGASDEGWPMTLTVVNEAPVANAGPDQTVSVKGKTTSVTLDGSASTDPERRALSYLWTLDGQVVGTTAAVQMDQAPGVYTFTLTVTDEYGATASDTVVVNAVRGNV